MYFYSDFDVVLQGVYVQNGGSSILYTSLQSPLYYYSPDDGNGVAWYFAPIIVGSQGRFFSRVGFHGFALPLVTYHHEVFQGDVL